MLANFIAFSHSTPNFSSTLGSKVTEYTTEAISKTQLPTPSFWGIRSRKGDSLVELAASPNGAVVLCIRSSGKLDYIDIADSAMVPFDQLPTMLDLFANLLTLSILNNVDHTDLESVLVSFARQSTMNSGRRFVVQFFFISPKKIQNSLFLQRYH